MSSARMLVAAFFFSGAFCPRGAHAVAHALNSAHLHSHENGTVHAHEHEAEGHHGDESLLDSHDFPRIAGSNSEWSASSHTEPILTPAPPETAAPVSRFAGAILDPPEASPRRPHASSRSGRSPPA